MERFLTNIAFSELTLLKIGILLGMVFYVIFAYIVVKQVNLMTKTLEVEPNRVIRAISKFPLYVAIAFLITALIIL